jgi:hypothetical protein
MDPRALFFLAAATLAAVLIPATPSDLRWVPELVAVTYLVLAVASYFDWRTANRG